MGDISIVYNLGDLFHRFGSLNEKLGSIHKNVSFNNFENITDFDGRNYVNFIIPNSSDFKCLLSFLIYKATQSKFKKSKSLEELKKSYEKKLKNSRTVMIKILLIKN